MGTIPFIGQTGAFRSLRVHLLTPPQSSPPPRSTIMLTPRASSIFPATAHRRMPTYAWPVRVGSGWGADVMLGCPNASGLHICGARNRWLSGQTFVRTVENAPRPPLRLCRFRSRRCLRPTAPAASDALYPELRPQGGSPGPRRLLRVCPSSFPFSGEMYWNVFRV